MQYKKVHKSSWNEPYSFSSFTKQSLLLLLLLVATEMVATGRIAATHTRQSVVFVTWRQYAYHMHGSWVHARQSAQRLFLYVCVAKF